MDDQKITVTLTKHDAARIAQALYHLAGITTDAKEKRALGRLEIAVDQSISDHNGLMLKGLPTDFPEIMLFIDDDVSSYSLDGCQIGVRRNGRVSVTKDFRDEDEADAVLQKITRFQDSRHTRNCK